MITEEIKNIIEESIPGSTAHVLDPMNDGQHLQALVIAPFFDGMMLVKQHQMVMKPLKEHMAAKVHALGLKTFTPAKWDQEKEKYGF